MKKRKLIGLVFMLCMIPGAYAIYHLLGMELTGNVTAVPGVTSLTETITFSFTAAPQEIIETVQHTNDNGVYEMSTTIDQAGISSTDPEGCTFEVDTDVVWSITSASRPYQTITDETEVYVVVDEGTTDILVKGEVDAKVCPLNGSMVITGATMEAADYDSVTATYSESCGGTRTLGVDDPGGETYMTDIVEHYFGDGFVPSGWEVATMFNDGTGGTATAAINLATNSSAYSVYILSSDSAMDVIASGEGSATWTAVAGVTYYIAVDGTSETKPNHCDTHPTDCLRIDFTCV